MHSGTIGGEAGHEFGHRDGHGHGHGREDGCGYEYRYGHGGEYRYGNRYRRSFDQLLEDGVFPHQLVTEGAHGVEVRAQVIAEVLRRLPDAAYGRLVQSMGSYTWFLPAASSLGLMAALHGVVVPEELGRIGPFVYRREPYARVLFLSPAVEVLQVGIASAIVAHLLAHVVLDHEPMATGRLHEAQEAEAFAAVYVHLLRDGMRVPAQEMERWLEAGGLS